MQENQERELIARDAIVISGVSGRYPESDNIDEFAANLFNGVDMVTESERRWPTGLYGLPMRNGTLKDISKFDSQFFGISPKQADQMDPQLRMLLEVSYEAICDSGINPIELRGTRTGVFIGVSSSEALYAYSHNPSELSGYSMTGCANSMLANRLSFFFDFKGPSYTVDTACSSSLVAMDAAVQAIKSKYCDYAIVGGSNLLTRPQTSLQFQRLGMLSPDGMCKSFDSSGNGYVRSETISVVFLQPKSTCRKFYAKIVNSRVNTDGAKEQGITFPNGKVQASLLTEIYSQSKVDPTTVNYVEAHGTGTKAGDPQELNSIADIFTKNRTSPLLIGSTKSNMGHPEPASGLAALSKILISIQSGTIPGNLHFKEPNAEIPALFDGRLKVVDKNTRVIEGLMALNSFGFGGANAHLIIEPNADKAQNLWSQTNYVKELSKKPRLFQFSSRTQQGLDEILDQVEKSEDLALSCILEPLSVQSLHAYRGFTILNSKNHIRETCQGWKQRPIWYVFSGMGTQWTGMGNDLMQIETFRHSIEQSALVLKPYDLDLIKIITCADSETFKRTLHSFVAIASIQIALVDCLDRLEIRPDGILGHSVGELGCAYADGCLTRDETLLAAFYRGKCIEDACLPPGAMAAVGLTWQECKNRCPDGVVPACHNSRDTVTISGPKNDVQNFVQQLKSEGVFAREVDSSNVAFHSYYMHQIGPKLKAYLSQVIKQPRLRSKKWISSSIPEENWHTDLAKYSSADYHVNNLCSAVLFQEALSHVPENAITIEIAPHALLQAILKRSLSKDNIFVGLINKNSSNQIENFYAQLGRLYLNGIDFKPTRLFVSEQWQKKIYPIPVKTKFVSPLIKWDHGHSWNVPRYTDFTTQAQSGESLADSSNFSFVIDLDGEHAYLGGHQIDGRVLYPATGYLCLVWQSVAKMRQIKRQGMIDEKMLSLPGIEFENVEIHKATILKQGEKINFKVNLMATSGQFELTESQNLVVTGQVRILEEKLDIDQTSQLESMTKMEQMTSKDFMHKEEIYKELRLRGYEYKDQFQPIEKSDLDGTCALLKWNGDWVTYLDAILQMNVLGQHRGLLLPTRVRSIRIDPELHLKMLGQDSILPVVFDPHTKATISGAVQIIGLHATVAPKKQIFQPTIIEKVDFVPHVDDINNNTVLLTQDEETRQNLVKKYLNECSSETINQSSNRTSFINFLNSKNKDGLEFLKLFTQDKLLNSTSQRLINFKHLIDVCFENLSLKSKSKKIRLLEICGSMCYSMCPGLKNLLRCHPQICDQIEIFYAQTSIQSHLESEFFVQTSSASLFPMQTIDWKMIQDNKLNTNVPSTMAQFDLVILNNSNLFNYENVSEWIQKVLNKLTNDFVLVIEDFVNNAQFKQLVANVEHLTLQKDRLKLSSFDQEQLEIFNLTKLIHRKAIGEQSLWRFGKKYQNTQFINIDNVDEVKWLDEIKQSLNDKSVDRVFLLSDWQTSGLIGMVNCLRKELNGEKIRCVFGQNLQQIPQSVLDSDLVMNVHQNNQWGSFRHIADDAQNLVINSENELNECQVNFACDKDNLCVNALQRGDLSSLKWVQSARALVPDNQHVVCKVAYAALNFRDIMLATGKLSPEAIPNYHKMQDNLLGMEFSGHVNEQKYMGIISARGLSTKVVVDKKYLWQVPDNWSLSDAATVPVAYSTAYYALCVRGKLKIGESVLIHAGSGAVGQAAIHIALSYQCRLFITVSSTEKRQYLKSRFNGQLSDKSFSNSRDLTFEKHVMRETGGRGVDLVLNCLSEQKLHASLRCLGEHGRFLEIGKFDLNKNASLGMAVFLKNISFHGILLDSLFDKHESDWKIVYNLVQSGIENGIVKPLNSTVFGKDEIEQAFRYMAQGKHIGKVLIDCADSNCVEPLAKVWFDPQQAYVVTGGLGGFGLELAQWLIERGVRHLVLSSRTGVRTGYQSRKIRMLQHEYNACVQVLALDVSCRQQCELLIEQSAKLSPSGKIGGIFHLAALLQDALLENQSVEKFKKVIQTKYEGAVNLDSLSRCSDFVDEQAYFVVFSSVTSGRGNLGQSNYGYANSAMERVCERRKLHGKHALAIQWGAIGDVGLVVESAHMNASNDTVVGGTLPQRVYNCLRSLEFLLLKSKTEHSATWSCFVPAFNGAGQSSSRAECDKNLVQTVANIMGIKDLKQIRNERQSLSEMGLDSLMSVEIKQVLEQVYNINLSMKEIQALSIQKLRQMQDMDLANVQSNNKDSLIPVDKQIKQLLMPSDILIQLNEFDEDQDTKSLFLVHPIEGHLQMLQEFATQIKRKVYGVQFTREASDVKSVADLARLYWTHIDKVKRCDDKIDLCGYSFGASVAFEMALQQTERVRTLTLLDGSHSYVNVHVNAYKTKLQLENLAETESEALFTFYLQYGQVESRTDFINKLSSMDTFEDRVKFVVDSLVQKSVYKFDPSDLDLAVRAFVAKLFISFGYEPKDKLRMQRILLIKSESQTNLIVNSDINAALGDDYGLSKVFDGTIHVKTVSGDHRTFLQGENLDQVVRLVSDSLL